MRRTAEQVVEKPESGQAEDFSLVFGGPLYQLLLRSKLIRPPFGNLASRMVVITALAWLPLVALTIINGRFAGGVPVPFIYDFEVHARLLLSLPIMVLAEVIVYLRMRAIAVQFIERQIITDTVRPAFDAIVSSTMRLRNSLIAEIAMLLLVFFVGPSVWRMTAALQADTWYATVTGSSSILTPAGRWYAYASVPVFQFILLRWYYRIFLWCRFLFKVSRLDLNLVPLHPDRCCGLGFLGTVAAAFSPLLTAHSVLVAGFIANRILHHSATLPDYKLELVAAAVVLLLIVLGPLCVFIPKLMIAKIEGLRTYGRMASDYVVSFAGKWNRGTAAGGEPLLGSADIQSLADLGNSFAVVSEVKLVPFGKHTIIQSIASIALPLVPLVFTMFSVEDILKRLVAILL
jgi:hypothetical protein